MTKISPGENDAAKNDYKFGNTTITRKTLRNLTVDFVSLNITESSKNSYDSRPPITHPAWSRITAFPLENITGNASGYDNYHKSKFTIDDLYAGYDPMVGVKTGGTLGGFLFLALIYFIKAKCTKIVKSRGVSKSAPTEEKNAERKDQERTHETQFLLEKVPCDLKDPHPELELPDLEMNSFDATAEWVQTQPLDVHSLSDMSIVINIEDASATEEEPDDEPEERIVIVHASRLGVMDENTLPSPIIEAQSNVGSDDNYPMQNFEMQRSSTSNPVSIPTIPIPLTRHSLGSKPRASSLKRPSEHGHSQSLCSNISNQKSRSSNTLHVRFSSDTMINKPKRKYRSQTSLRSNSCSSGSSRSSRRSDRSSRSDSSNPSTKPLLKRLTDKFNPTSGRWYRSCDHLSVDYDLQAAGHSDSEDQTSMMKKSRSVQDTSL